MGRRGARPTVPQHPIRNPRPNEERVAWSAEGHDEPPEETPARIGELLRRVALGSFAALMTARAYWPSEPELHKGAGSGLGWVLAMLVVAGLGVAASFVGGRFRFRWSWADASVVALMLLVGMSASHGLDRRVAINLGWGWAGMGVAYLLARNLPRTREESAVLAGCLVATAVAVSTYGLYQAGVEIPWQQARFNRDPQAVMREAGIAPGEQQMRAMRDRLVGSNEPFSTFGLPNSLAGFLVGPLVLVTGLALQNLSRRERDAAGSRWTALGMAVVPILIVLACLILTKSRSAYIGLVAALAVHAWRERHQVPARLLVGACLAVGTLIVALVVVGAATGRLDRQVLTQSTMSMRYRWEYWQSTWGVITEGASTLSTAWNAPTFWAGVGPGNFGSHYLRYKLPWSSEEIQDPHNLFLEVWETAGFWALAALLSALVLGCWNLLGPGRPSPSAGSNAGPRPLSKADAPLPSLVEDDDSGPCRNRWLIFASGLGGWVGVVLLGQLNPFQDELFTRWLILGGSWLAAAWLVEGLWRRVPIAPNVFAAAVLAMVVNLLAAGGIGYPAVALMLWALMALGMNLREDRPCGHLHEVSSRLPGFALAIVWAALIGSFVGAINPFWKSEAAIRYAEDAMSRQPPDFEAADRYYDFASRVDQYNARPWLGRAYLQYLVWEARGAKADDLRWKTIPVLLLKAASRPRNPDVWSLHSERAQVTRDLLNRVGNSLSPREIIPLQASIVEATRTASRLYPTNARLRARLAEASADISMFQDAEREAKEALRLDKITPHLDKKLPDEVRRRLEALLPDWTEKASKFKLDLN